MMAAVEQRIPLRPQVSKCEGRAGAHLLRDQHPKKLADRLRLLATEKEPRQMKKFAAKLGAKMVLATMAAGLLSGVALDKLAGANAEPKASAGGAVVENVVDGDTISIRVNGGTQKVRILGINTPEVYGQKQCGGSEASAALKKMLPAGTEVSLVGDPSQADSDKYGRALRYVSAVPAGERNIVDIGQRQVTAGHARVYVFANKPFERAAIYKKAQAKASATGKGLWGHCSN